MDSRCKSIGGASGAFFYFTADKQFILKTINHDELLVINSMIDAYTERVTSNRKTYLARIFGTFKIKVNKSNSITVLLMENLGCRMENPIIFDMKGSTVNRRITNTEYSSLESIPRDKVYKEYDNGLFFININ